MVKKIEEQILKGNFECVRELVIDLNYRDLQNTIFTVAYDTSSIAVYSCIVSLLLEDCNAQNNELAADLLSFQLCFYKGAYSVALFHSRKALSLELNNLEYKTFLILFHDIPERLVLAQEAIQIATDILSIDPDVKVAQDVLKKYEKGIVDSNNIFLPVPKISGLFKDTITKELYTLLYYAKFEKAQELVKDLTLEELFEIMSKIGQHEQTLTMYGYVVSLLLEHETAELHQLASRVLAELLNSIEGAFISAYWHAARAVELDSKNETYRLYLLKLEASLNDS